MLADASSALARTRRGETVGSGAATAPRAQTGHRSSLTRPETLVLRYGARRNAAWGTIKEAEPRGERSPFMFQWKRLF